MPYIQISKLVECVDDPKSKYYNKLVSRNKINSKKDIDWTSSEKMFNSGIYYELGVIVDHNCCPNNNDYGSCIFLHNWAEPDETTAGCTAMAPQKMKKIVLWLDKTKFPILVQLTKSIYSEKSTLWNLPIIK